MVVSALLCADLPEIAPVSVAIGQGGYTVNKNDLIAAVAERSGMSKADVGRAVDATLETITEALKKNDDVRIVGFGTYSVSERSATQGRNPRTGQPIKIPAQKQAKFRPGKALKDALN
jgi:DNA-binding protein HU-beta